MTDRHSCSRSQNNIKEKDRDESRESLEKCLQAEWSYVKI